MKILKKLLILTYLCTSLSSCDFNLDSTNEYIGYANDTAITNNDLEIKIANFAVYGENGPYSTMFNINVTNSNSSSITTSLDDLFCYRESDGADYKISPLASDLSEITLNCDLEWGVTCMLTLPTSPEEENYYVTFTLNHDNYRFNLYEKPDYLKNHYEVNFYVDDNIVKTITVAELDVIANLEWVSSDYIYYCNEWYYDKNYTNSVGEDKIVDSMDLYGRKKTILRYSDNTSSSTCSVSSVNYIPESGKIIIPRSYSGKKVSSLLYGSFVQLLPGLKYLYIPKDVSYISKSNFLVKTDLRIIYFEGSSTLWDSIYESSTSSSVYVVFNTYI